MAGILSELTSKFTSALANLPSPETIQDAERMQLLGAIDKLRAALEPPMISLLKLCFSDHAITAVRIAQGMGVFDAFAASGGAEMTLSELNSKTKGDQQLLFRMMRLLACNDIVTETGREKYKPSALALMLVTGAPQGDAVKHFYPMMQVSAKLYDYFEANGYKNPGDAYDGPFQFGMGTKEHYFDWLSSRPADLQTFNSVMAMGRAILSEEWFEYFPVQEKLHASPDRTILIDIGGGIGHEITAFKKKFPELPGKLVLQDLPQVIDDISEPLPDGVEAVKYDMFKPQPIKGAKAYYMRTVLHDWPDKQVLQVLAQIHEAMTEDSVLLLNENLLPDTNVPAHSAHADFLMMEGFASLERTEQQWIDLLEAAEFKVVKVWKPKHQVVGSNALFEATLK